jgi:hypothetical protein
MRVNVAIPESEVSAPILNSALESVTRLNESMLKQGKIPTFEDGLKEGIKWKPEPPGEEHFDHAGTVLRRKWGDCDDLAPWQAASLRVTGEDPNATAIVRRSGPKRWHAIVRRGDGSIDDPSRAAGMGQPTGVVGASLPIMYTAPSAVVGGVYNVRPALAMRGFRGGVQARADMPMQFVKGHPTDYAIATTQAAPSASAALVGAIEGALQLAVAGGYAHPQHINRLAAIADALEGIPLEEIAACYGDEHAAAAQEAVVGFSLKKLAKGALKTGLKMAPMASKLVQFVPGIGPVASSALDIAAKGASMLQKGKGAADVVRQAARAAAPFSRGAATPESPAVPSAGPRNPFPSVEAFARQGRICIPATWE